MTLTRAPTGAMARAEVLETAAKILYLKPTTEKLADGVWCITYQIGVSLRPKRRWDLLVKAGSNFDEARMLVLSASIRF